MANTKIPSELSSTPSISDSGDATAITINSSEQVGVGVSPDTLLHVSTTGSGDKAKIGNGTRHGFIAVDSSGVSLGNEASQGGELLYLNEASGYASIFTGGSERVRFEASGNVSIGSTSDSNQLLVSKATDIDMSAGGAGQFRVEGNGYSFAIAMNGTGVHMYQNSSGRDLIWGNNETEQMRLNASGHLLVGTTSVASTTLDGTGGSNNAVVIGAENTAYPVLVLQSSHQRWLADYITNDGSLRTYNTTSNYETMITDTSGRVTFPKQPHVQGSVTNSSNTNAQANTFAAGTYSRGTLTVSVVSNQARFTAPVAGLYLILFNTIMSVDTSRRDATILVNGSTISQSLNDVSNGYHYRQMAQVLDLSANDYVTFGNENWYDNTSTSYTVWRTASMTLIG
tara:strand:- start:1822 stop:3015 length:1194 start_codon:yes stop_codon:yes gene_type:complete